MAPERAKPSIKQTERQDQGKRPRGIEKHPPRSIRKCNHLVKIQQQTLYTSQTTKPKSAFPSPSASGTSSKEISHSSSPVLPIVVTSLDSTQTSGLASDTDKAEQPRSLNGHESTQILDPKRKRSQGTENPGSPVQGESTNKRARISSSRCAAEITEDVNVTNEKDSDNDLPIEHWRKTGSWPKKLFQPDPNMSQQLTQKRSSSATSYNQGVKQGQYPSSHTPAYESQILGPAGIFLDQQLGEASISDDCRKLCTVLGDARYNPPENSLFEEDLFWKVTNGVRIRNEARVVRDISPWLTPSAELLYMRGVVGLKDLIEEVQAEWTHCVPLVGPVPKPDLTVGFRATAFTNDEIEKLKYYRTPEKATLFIRDLYFPFLVCEAKCGENGLNKADRQNARSASTSVNAILQLYRSVSRAEKLHRKILVFSVSHDHHLVQIYGHYALVKQATATFHRHLIHSFDITAYDGKNRWTAYNFVRKIYDHFAPILLEDIKDVISQIPEFESSISIEIAEVGTELADSRNTASAPVSIDNEGFVKPALPPNKKRQLSTDWNAVQIHQVKQQLEESKRQHAESMQQLAGLMEQNKKLIDILSKG